MEAVIFDSKSLKLTYQKDYPIPQITKDDEVLIKIEYSGVCGTDLHIIRGQFPVTKARPIVMGHESSGIVHAVGKDCVFKVGQKVVIDPNSLCGQCNHCRSGNYQYCLVAGMNNTIGIWKDGGWAQYCVAPQCQVYLVPDHITTEKAGLTEPYSCVAHGFDRASPLKVGQKILVAGAGIIGNLWVTVLHHHGHRDVTVAELNPSRLEIVKRLETDFRLVSPDVLANENIEYDVIIDCTGVGKVMETNMNYMGPGGKYVLFGCCPATQTATITPFEIYRKELTVIGIKINPYTFINAISWVNAMGDRYLDYHKLGVKTYRLSEYETAIEDLRAGKVAKVMFKINQD